MPSIVIRIRQKGYVRSTGYQATNWAVTVPVSDPIATPPIATAPISFAPLYLIRQTNEVDALLRVATLQDFVEYPRSELKLFDIRGPGGDQAFAPLFPGGPPGPGPNYLLKFPETAGRLSYWLDDYPPYNTNTFVVKQRLYRAQGTTPQALPGNRIQLPGYTFTERDVGRWVYLLGFASPYNGLSQIQSYVGNTAVVDRTITTTEAGTAWAFPIIEIESALSPGLEPRYFPTREKNLSWELTDTLGALVASSTTGGGVTMRDSEATIVRSLRYTQLCSSSTAASNLMSVIRNGAANLQRGASLADTDLTALITSTYGP